MVLSRISRINKYKSNIIFYAIILSICAFIYFIYTSSYFERKKPSIEVQDIDYWNLKWDIPLKLSDESGIRHYRISLQIDSENESIILDKDASYARTVELILPKPKVNVANNTVLKYKIEVIDGSKNRFFLGNNATKELKIIVDKVPPQARIIAMSNRITKGGSAAVVFYANDDALGNISVSTGENSFVAFPFVKENYYVSIIPWSIYNDKFYPSIVVQDKAGNVKYSNIGFARYGRTYRTSNINLKNNFIDGKIAELIEIANEIPLDRFPNRTSMFKYVNETLRERDKMIIDEHTLNMDSIVPFDMNFNTFRPLKDYVIVGLYGDYRNFFLDKVKLGESYHLGIDLANSKNAPITLSNDGVVLLSKELGVHGNTVMVDHGFGVSSMYAHLSSISVKDGDRLKAGEVIGNTGATGLALGDHLHFTIFIQGVSVLPSEWMDSKWLKSNILNVLEDGKNIIENKK